MDDASIAFVVRETGWALEYIRALPVSQFYALLEELYYLRQIEEYGHAHDAAMIVCALVNTHQRQYRPKDIIGEPPERREKGMEVLGTTPEPKKITLADGKEYEISPITVNTFCDLETKFGQSFTKIFDGRIMPLRYLVFLLIKNKPADMTEESVGAIITPEMLGELRKLIGV